MGGGEGFWPLFTLLGVTIRQKSSAIQTASLVSRALTEDMPDKNEETLAY
jgi:hypothetical protein